MPKAAATRRVSAEVFRQIYDSPHSLPGKHKWLTADADVRRIEKLLGMQPDTIGAPLWVSGDTKNCPKCGRETNWLDIVASGVSEIHSRAMIAKVILGDQKFVNFEAPRALAGLVCYRCKTPIRDLRSFKCHNWAYAMSATREIIEELK